MINKFKECLRANYTTVENCGDYSVERDGETLKIFFEWSDGATDWKNNFNFPAKPYRKMKNKWFAHRGFLKVWKSIEPYLAEYINDLTVSKIDIVGYSHGAAVALLCYEYVKFNRPDVEVSGVGFGSPRVFWGFACKEVMKRFEGFIVVRNGRDLVTHVPPLVFGFRHVGELKQIGKSKGIIRDHTKRRYIEALKEYEKAESVKNWVKQRDEMLLKCDINELRKFVSAHPEMYGKAFINAINEADDEILTTSLHKMRVAAVRLPESERDKSAAWLSVNGFRPL